MVAAFLLSALLAANAAQPKAEVRNVRFSSPRLAVSREKAGSAALVNGQVKVDMSFARETVRMPVLRIMCIVEVGGELVCHAINLARTRTTAPLSRGDVMAAYKDAGVDIPSKDREAALSDPARFTPFLREVAKGAYSPAVYGTADVNKGFFRLGRTDKMPKILLFRVELWQNGALAGFHESSRAGLGSYDIPADWHVWKKHPQKFRYTESR